MDVVTCTGMCSHWSGPCALRGRSNGMSKAQELKRQDRSTRAKRYQAALNDELEKNDDDQSFWNLEFFQGGG